MVNSKENIPLCEPMRAARHNSTEAHLGYCEADEEAHSKRYRAMASKVEMKDELLDKNLGDVGVVGPKIGDEKK